MNFAGLLRAHRKRTGKTQEIVASELGISRTYVSQIECGRANGLSFDLAVRLLNLSGVAHGQIQVTLPRKVFVDATLAPEIVWLNESGIETVSSCLGPPATALIAPSSACKAKELGYTPLYMEDVGLFQIELRSKTESTF